MTQPTLVEIRQLGVRFTKRDRHTTVFESLSLDIREGEILCLVGESGSGKSVAAKSIMQLLPQPAAEYTQGQIRFGGRDLLTLSEKEMEAIRGKRIAMIFQDALSALNPVYTIGTQMIDLIRLHAPSRTGRKQALAQAKDLLKQVEIRNVDEVVKQYPFQLSGGMRQRVMIAMALSSRPELLLADEPTTALDVTVQAQILRLILKLKREYGMTVLFITHDLGVVHEVADRVIVMRSGELVEESDKAELFRNPKHPYTRQLLGSMPRIYFEEARP
ncbi:ABC transporter ATP-binding protein [Saccharibacillus sp. CPCC 101409]|uniref:ABC transporter ATP-binding protein n=1 Tax=Saccharibacillus sp. CPCC 101409 TaxID=3058041 RepID=UPI0026733E15|nr:ABC transporter ATP-binding protein [Saccharibacillus sp. CPCC 101409]MDO3412418.1 ABC transporter ATP-binding protein [Saccharibacillus sp. CPCC 101409]